jgi:hypothetical protein
MAPMTFHLLQVHSEISFLSSLRTLNKSDRPIYIGKCRHWIHEPHSLSVASLLGTGPKLEKWDFLLAHPSPTLPASLGHRIRKSWSITAPVSDEQLASYSDAHAKRLSSTTNPQLPRGWSKDDHSGLDASVPPTDVEFSLGLESYPLGVEKEAEKPVKLKDWIREFGTKYHEGPVQMCNIMSSLPG